MKISTWLRAFMLSTMAGTGTCALAQFEGAFKVPENTATPTVRIIYPQEGAAFLLEIGRAHV